MNVKEFKIWSDGFIAAIGDRSWSSNDLKKLLNKINELEESEPINITKEIIREIKVPSTKTSPFSWPNSEPMWIAPLWINPRDRTITCSNTSNYNHTSEAI